MYLCNIRTYSLVILFLVCVVGDGEAQEGEIWEAANTAHKYGLDNLIVFVDYNNLQLDGTCDRITYNDLCRGCTHSCKQSFRAVVILCPRYYSKRRKKEDGDNGR